MTDVAGPPENILAAEWGGTLAQVAWTTTDIERAISLLSGWLGASDFVRVADRRLRVTTPDGKRSLRQKLAFGRSASLSIEVIEPIGDDGGFWSDGLPRVGFGLRQHHLSTRIRGDRSAWQAFRTHASGMESVPIEGVFGETHFLFVDLRATLGTYLEAVWCPPIGG